MDYSIWRILIGMSIGALIGILVAIYLLTLIVPRLFKSRVAH